MPPLPPFPHFGSTPVARSSSSPSYTPNNPGPPPSDDNPSHNQPQDPNQGEDDNGYAFPALSAEPVGSGSRTPSVEGVQPVSRADWDVPGPSGSILASQINRPFSTLVPAASSSAPQSAELHGQRDTTASLDDAQDGDEGEASSQASGEDVDDAAMPDSPGPGPSNAGQAAAAVPQEPFEPLYHSPNADLERKLMQQQQAHALALDVAVEDLPRGRGGARTPLPGEAGSYHTGPTAAGTGAAEGSSTFSTVDTRVERDRPSIPHLGKSLPAGSGPSIVSPLPPGAVDPSLLRADSQPPPTRDGRPAPRIRPSTLRAMQLHRGSSAIQAPGAEQGVDPRRDSAAKHWGHIQQACAIEVCDYSSTSVTFTRLSNSGLAAFLSSPSTQDTPSWAKVRWINVGGISWDVVRALALRYDLHPLATEDVLRCGEVGARSKSDYYRNHLFLSLIAHSLVVGEGGEEEELPSYDEALARSGSGAGSGNASVSGEQGEGGGAVFADSPVDDANSGTALTGSGSPSGPSGGVRRRRGSSVWKRAKDTVVAAAAAGAGAAQLKRTQSRDDIESTLDKGVSGTRGGHGVLPDLGQVPASGALPPPLEGLGLGLDLADSPPSLKKRLRRRRSSSPGPSLAHQPSPTLRPSSTFAAPDPERDAPDRKAAEARTLAKQRQWASWMNMSPVRRRKALNNAALQELKRGAHVGVELKHIYVFLTRGGTLITFHQDPDLSTFEPIKSRLQHQDSLLRAHCDASLLMQSVVDLVVDKALEIVERYHDTLLDLERQTLIKPSMKTVRQLHIMSGDLTLHKRTLTPLSTMIYALRRYDLDRAVAATPEAQDGKDVKVTGFCSHQCKVYLADVYDHMEYILSSMDMFSSIAENLINFTFNIVSYETNQSMRRLTVATVLFFPLTFLTGYFGMNFQQMNSLVGSDLFFWEVSLPVMFVITIMFTYNDILKLYRAFMRNRRFDLVKEKLKITTTMTARQR